MVDFVADDRIDLVYDLLVSIQVQLAVVETDHEFWVVAVHSLGNRRVYLHVHDLHVAFEQQQSLELGEELRLGAAAVLGSPLVDLTSAHLLNRLLNLRLNLVHLFLAFLLGLTHNKADFWQDKGQLQLVVLQQNQNVPDFLLQLALRAHRTA